ncbi:ABC transporter permease [Actinomyces sp. S4-C9]|uniref:ABC transporter permease n=1 Tax=Actinomyces sp. S4-C9 TaxID=1219581 RepID=UPI00050FC495|nr:ABC transporter permease [Actinomyces sp. S4-C9]KGF02797.1 ABC transporter permease [Actinomyces sp. S4-C9]
MSQETNPQPTEQKRPGEISEQEREVEKPAGKKAESDKVPFGSRLTQRLFSINTAVILGAIAVALVLGALIVVIFNEDVQTAAGYLFAQPSDFFQAAGSTFQSFFSSLFRGSIYNYQADSFAVGIKPLLETLTRSVPLIIAGLAIAVSFRAGLFNIGVQGQLIMGAFVGTVVGMHLHLPIVLHLIVAVVCAVLGGALWGAIPGFLKAKVGANEVIVTIMLNSIALLFLSWTLSQEFMKGDGSAGKSMYVADTATYPSLLGSSYRLDLSFIIAILAAVFVWWLLERSTFGFELRAAGANPNAARTAGISVPRVIFLTLVISGGLAGLAGTAPVLGTEKFLTSATAGSYGFDAITVALLGKSTPLGTVLAGILFGALAAGGSTMQAAAGIPVDIVQVTQAIIVLLIAASEAVQYYRNKRKVAARASVGAKKEAAK